MLNTHMHARMRTDIHTVPTPFQISPGQIQIGLIPIHIIRGNVKTS